MSNKKPLTNSNGLIREFASGDYIDVKYGGTGKTSLPKDSIIIGNTDKVKTIKFNFDATNPPSASDDVTAQYEVGSKWYDIVNHVEYTCLDNTENNAIWKSFNSSITVDYAEFNQDANHQTTTGQIAWNDTDKTFDLGLADGSVLQAGQEMMIYVHNETGSTIPNGRVVYITSPPTPDDTLHIAMASCDSDTAYSTIAVTTNEIPDGSMGYCTLVGRVRELNTSSFSDGDKLYLSTNGTITNVEVAFPNHSVEIGYCIKSDPTSGVIFVHVEKQFAVEDLYNVIISNPSQGDSFIYENNKWINRNFGAITKESTGFKNPESIVITYDPTTRRITLTGSDISAYWRSNSIPELTGTIWTSEPHNIGVTQNQYLYYDLNGFHWSTSFPSFDIVSIATVAFSTSGVYTGTIRECHGTMQWQVHRELHQIIGCYASTGGDLSSYILNSTTPINRRLDVGSTTLNDEDLQTVNDALTSKLYNIIYLSGSNTRNYTDDYSDIIPVNGSRPYINIYSGGTWTQKLIDNNNYACIFVVAIPRASDALSQKRRYSFIQPQIEFTTLDAAKSYTTNSINYGNETNIAQEFTFIGKIIIRYTGGDWSLTSVEKLTGSKISQTIEQGNLLTIVYHDSTLTGDGTIASPLSVVQSLTSSQYYRIHSAMMGSATGSLGFFSIQPQNINPFENALTTSGDIFNNGKLNPIMIPFNWKLTELHIAVGHCAVAQSTAAPTVTMRIEFFSHTGISRTSIGFVDVPLNGINCGIYNNLGNNNYQTSNVVNIINIIGNANDLIGWQFTNRGVSNDQINAVAQVTIEAKFEEI